MAQKSNNKRQERRDKSDRNMNRAIVLLISGLIAEWYLLMAYRFCSYNSKTNRSEAGFLNGARLDQWFRYCGVMRWVGLALLVAGVALAVLRRKKDWKSWVGKLGGGLAVGGAFFALTSEAGRHLSPVTVLPILCVFVPVVLVLGIIYLFYQAEFSVQATALAAALFALGLLNRSNSALVRLAAVLAIVFVAAILVCTFLLKKNGGALKLGDRRLRLFPAEMDYRLTLAVPALGIVLVAAALAASDVAFYGAWLLGVLTFALAVYYTVKLM